MRQPLVVLLSCSLVDCEATAKPLVVCEAAAKPVTEKNEKKLQKNLDIEKKVVSLQTQTNNYEKRNYGKIKHIQRI